MADFTRRGILQLLGIGAATAALPHKLQAEPPAPIEPPQPPRPHTPRAAHVHMPAACDLTDSQYRFVKANSDGTVSLAGPGDPVLGVLQNAPRAGNPATIQGAGVTKVLVADSASAGMSVAVDEQARAARSRACNADGILTEDSDLTGLGAILLA